MEESDQWTHFAPIAKLESLDEIDQDSSRHSTAGLAAPTATAQPLLSSTASGTVGGGGSSGALSAGAGNEGTESSSSSSGAAAVTK